MKSLSNSMIGFGAAMAVVGTTGIVYARRETNNYEKEEADIEQKIELVKQERASVGSELENCLTSNPSTPNTSNGCNLLSLRYEILTNKYNELQVDLSKVNENNNGNKTLLFFAVFSSLFLGGIAIAGGYGLRD